jgi:hypothetical protein
VAGALFDRHVLNHYQSAISEIRERGFYSTAAKASEPYIEALWYNFSTERQTITEDLVSGKLIGQTWTAVRRWFGSECPPPPSPPDSKS